MKCHYEVLDVPRHADDAEIKSSYRKLALKWHPDKNLDDPENAKEQFQIVQQAYEVLSDRQERAWYDNHREQILRGSSSEFQDKSLDVFQYFTSTCFKGYGDDENSFYAVYSLVFEKIAKEDMEFMEDKEEYCDIPNFGNSQTDYQKVSEFYAYWLNYSTKKSFVWLDPHNIKDIRDRRYIKLVEKENKKVRQNAKKERNEEIRSLVAFVKKRDKRVQANKKIQEQKLLEDKKKREMLSNQKRLERQEELNKSKDQPEWTKFDNVKTELKEIERTLAEQFGEEFSNSDYESEDEDLSNLYCVACNKIFKTPKAFENHETSKKHKENIFLLKETMLEEENDLASIECNEVETNDSIDDNIEEEVLTDNSSESESIEDVMKTRKKKKKTRNIINLDEVEPACFGNLDKEDNSDEDFSMNKKPKKKNRKSTVHTTKVKEVPQENEDKSTEQTHEEDSENKIPMRKVKKKEKRSKNEIIATEIDDIDTDHNCVTCKSNFPSKNKLFDHLKKTGHGVYIPPSATKTKNKKKNIKEK